MNSPASFVKSLLAQCCLGGICEWVVCPGARNMALLQVLAQPLVTDIVTLALAQGGKNGCCDMRIVRQRI